MGDSVPFDRDEHVLAVLNKAPPLQVPRTFSEAAEKFNSLLLGVFLQRKAQNRFEMGVFREEMVCLLDTLIKEEEKKFIKSNHQNELKSTIVGYFRQLLLVSKGNLKRMEYFRTLGMLPSMLRR